MAEDLVNFLFDPPPDRNVFTVSGKAVYDPDNPVPGTLISTIKNESNDWIDVVGESHHPVSERLFTTGKLNKGAVASGHRQLTPHVGQGIRLTRWAPGVFGIPGSGGQGRIRHARQR